MQEQEQMQDKKAAAPIAAAQPIEQEQAMQMMQSNLQNVVQTEMHMMRAGNFQ